MYLARIRTTEGVVPALRVNADTLVRLDLSDGIHHDDLVELANLVMSSELGDRLRARESADPSAPWAVPVATAQFEVPVAKPQKIVCVALNYLAHAQEGEQQAPSEPVIFFKPPSALLAHRGDVRCPPRSARVDYEVELAVVIGQVARYVPRDRWRDVVAGYTVLNDMTARDMQLEAIERNQPWDHSKGFDTFAPCGPYLVTRDAVPDPMQLDLSLTVDDRIRQKSNTREMLFSIPELIEVISAGITLEPGDIIATGTPSGIGPVEPGATMFAEVQDIGVLSNTVVYDRIAQASLK